MSVLNEERDHWRHRALVAEERLAQVEAERNAAQAEVRETALRLADARANLRAADALAAAVDVMIERRLIDSRSVVGDRRLDYGEPFEAERARQLAWCETREVPDVP